jgi:stage II sporulation protein D
VRAQVVGTRGRTSVSGPQLRSKLGLYDTWARFTVITASAVRGDGNTPKPAGGGAGEPGTGGAEPRTGGAAPRAALPLAAAREALGAAAAGAIAGRVAPAVAGRWVTLERFTGRAWVAQFETLTGAGGAYRANVGEPGLYRVRYAGEAGPPVRVTRRRE